MSPVRILILVLALAILAVACRRATAGSQEASPSSPSPTKEAVPMTQVTPPVPGLETATLGGGCFWCVEAVFQELRGVHSVESGYAGGHVADPTYEQVCRGNTGHAEVVNVYFDPREVSYREILEVFFQTHDPTTLNRQGADAGPQYRSAVFHHGEEQRKVAEEVKAEAASWWDDPIVTEVAPFTNFYPAEAYHQDYFEANPAQPYCSFVIAPKMKKFREKFGDQLKRKN